MKKKHSKILAFGLAALLGISNVTPAFAAVPDFIFRGYLEGTIIQGPKATDSSALPEATLSNAVRSGSALDYVIEDEGELVPLFPDDAFRKVVFDAVEGTMGTDLEDALANYTGDISAKNKGITDVTGLRYLKRASNVDLRNNQISDWTPAAGDGERFYSGFWDGEYHDSEWNITGNPFRVLPENFGGRLVIAQAATAASNYSDPNEEFHFIREQVEHFSAETSIQKCVIQTDSGQRDAKVISVQTTTLKQEDGKPVAGSRWDKPLAQVDSFDNKTVKFSNLVKSGTQVLAVGMDQEIRYSTADESDTITPGSQSFKYYLEPKFYVYDRIHLVSNEYKGSVVLTKTNKDNSAEVVVGARYELRKDSPNGVSLGEYTTDRQGQITVPELSAGLYYFVETVAPDGYVLDSTPVEVEIKPHKTSLAGGLSSAKDSDGSTESAGEDECFIAGPDSPDIRLERLTNDGKVEVTVKYSSLGAAPAVYSAQGTLITEAVEGKADTKVFYSVTEAATDINDKKNANQITGRVDIEVNYVKTASGAVRVSATNQVKPTDPGDPVAPPEPEITQLSGKKTWVDEPGYTGLHPDISIELYRNGTYFDQITLHDGQEEYTFHQLPKLDDKGGGYRYTVKEKILGDGEAEKFFVQQNGNNFTNTYINGKLNIQGYKVWEDGDGAPAKHPSVEIVLYRNGTKMSSYILNPGKDFYRFEGLDQRDAQGRDYQYTVEEKPVAGYRSVKDGKYNFINIYDPDNETPDKSDRPDGPDEPDKPDKPSKPHVPEDPQKPQDPETPSVHEEPGETPLIPEEEMPDPEDPNSPETVVTVNEHGEIKHWIRHRDPEMGTYTYILDETVPQGNIWSDRSSGLPKTGDEGLYMTWILLIGGMAVSLTALKKAGE